MSWQISLGSLKVLQMAREGPWKILLAEIRIFDRNTPSKKFLFFPYPKIVPLAVARETLTEDFQEAKYDKPKAAHEE